MSYPAAKHRAAGGPKKGYVKDTPIYRAAIDLLNFTLNTTKDFSRQMRPTLGKILIESTVDLVGKVCKANAARDKYQHLTEAIEVVESIAAMWQAAHEVRLINLAAFAKAIELTECIARQAAGWRKAFSGA